MPTAGSNGRTIIAFNAFAGNMFLHNFFSGLIGSAGPSGPPGPRGLPGSYTSVNEDTYEIPFPLDIVTELPIVGSYWHGIYGEDRYVGHLILAPSGNIYKKIVPFGWELVMDNKWVK